MSFATQKHEHERVHHSSPFVWNFGGTNLKDYIYIHNSLAMRVVLGQVKKNHPPPVSSRSTLLRRIQISISSPTIHPLKEKINATQLQKTCLKSFIKKKKCTFALINTVPEF